MHLYNCFPTILSVLFRLLPEQLYLEGQWEVANSEISYPLAYQNVREGKTTLFNEKMSESSEFYYLQSGIYPSNTDFVGAMNILIREKHNHSGSSITIKVSQRRQKVDIFLGNEESGLAFFSTNLGHIFGSNVGNEWPKHILFYYTTQLYPILIHYRLDHILIHCRSVFSHCITSK